MSKKEIYCISCKSPIPVGASICKECMQYQAEWKNKLKYASTVIGVLVIFLSGLTYIYTSVVKLIKTDDISVSALKMELAEEYVSLILINNSDYPAILHAIKLTMTVHGKYRTSITVPINKRIGGNEIDFYKSKDDQPPLHDYMYLGKDDELRFDLAKILNEVNGDNIIKTDSCIYIEFFTKDQSDYSMFIDREGSPNNIPEVNGTLYYSNADRKVNQEKNIQIYPLIFLKREGACLDKYKLR